MVVAEPVAHAMGALHRIESTGGAALGEAAPSALGWVRQALALLQAQQVVHPAVDQAMEAIAGSLGVVHQLAQLQPAPPQAPAAVSGYGGTLMAPAPLAGFAPSQTAAVPPSQQQHYAPPQAAMPAHAAPGHPNAAAQQPRVPQHTAPSAAGYAPQAAAPQPPVAYAPPQAPAQQPPAYAPQPPAQHAPAGYAPQAAPPLETPPPYAPPQAQRAAKAPTAAVGHADGNGPMRVEAALGAHSATNFYKGLSGNDVIESGGIFVGTYQIPSIGSNVVIKVSLPGGYEFEALGVVRWTREASESGADDVSPGFGAQFTQISPEGRQLVYRYVRNREPLFHDDF
jgi:Tfp pilus assembly protein PilZ